MRIGARARIDIFLDVEGRAELGADLEPVDRLKFRDGKKYKDRLTAAQKQTGEKRCAGFHERYFAGHAGGGFGVRVFLHGRFDGRHRRRAFRARRQLRPGKTLPDDLLRRFRRCADAGSADFLMQMAKTSAVLARLREEGIPFISVLTDPVYGGVSASLAMLGDVIVGEPKALIGFAGPRVIEQTVREKLPEGFQRSEFLLEHGAIDMIIDRQELRPRLGNLLAQMMGLPTPKFVATPIEPIVVPPVPANL